MCQVYQSILYSISFWRNVIYRYKLILSKLWQKDFYPAIQILTPPDNLSQLNPALTLNVATVYHYAV